MLEAAEIHRVTGDYYHLKEDKDSLLAIQMVEMLIFKVGQTLELEYMVMC